MKYVIALIQPNKLDEVREALSRAGIIALTASEVGGTGNQKGRGEIYRGSEYHPAMTSKVKVEIALPESLAELATEIIAETANSQKIGDGKIFVLDLESVTRVRTGETGEAALGQGTA